MHGGTRVSGIAHHSTKTGRYSKYLPARLAARYEEAQTDDELLGLREEVALTDSRLSDLLGRVDTGESGDAWKQADRALSEFRKALAKDDPTSRAVAFDALKSAIDSGRSDYTAWDEIHKLIEQRRRLVESERRHLEQMGQMVAVSQIMLLIGQLTALIREHVHDRDTLKKLSTGINRIISIDA